MIPSIAPRQDRLCEICGRPASDQHHVLHRSQGGSDHDHNLQWICRECHTHAHRQGNKTWEITRDAQGLRVVCEGEIIVERYNPPPAFDEGLLVAEITTAPYYLKERSEWFKYLSDEGLLAVAEGLVELDRTQWLVRARLGATMRLRTPYGKTTELLTDVASRTGISYGQLRKEMAALREMEAHPELVISNDNWTPDAVLLAVTSDDPEKAMSLYAPEYSTRTYQKTLAEHGLAKAPAELCTCQECGAVHRKAEKV